MCPGSGAVVREARSHSDQIQLSELAQQDETNASQLAMGTASKRYRLINEAAPAPPNSAALVRLNHTCPFPVRR